MSETARTRNNISTLEERRPPKRQPSDRYPSKSSLERAERLKIEKAEAKHRRQEERAEAKHRRRKDNLYTWAGVGIVLGITILCVLVLLLNYSVEDKKWATTILTHGATALTTYIGVKRGFKAPSTDD